MFSSRDKPQVAPAAVEALYKKIYPFAGDSINAALLCKYIIKSGPLSGDITVLATKSIFPIKKQTPQKFGHG